MMLYMLYIISIRAISNIYLWALNMDSYLSTSLSNSHVICYIVFSLAPQVYHIVRFHIMEVLVAEPLCFLNAFIN
jgi:hypothetical protein